MDKNGNIPSCSVKVSLTTSECGFIYPNIKIKCKCTQNALCSKVPTDCNLNNKHVC